ncbi:MAG TPA: PxKF domain-containing protein [Terriglobia bacterium]|nr:PxKF domain-containing protein [Terriglobia bacterium]
MKRSRFVTVTIIAAVFAVILILRSVLTVAQSITPASIITTVAGNGTADYRGDNGPATSAEIRDPIAVAVDSAGNVYIADTSNSRVRKVSTSGTITTFAGGGTGCAGQTDSVGDGCPATSANFALTYGVAVDSAGNVYIADTDNFRLRKVGTDGIITTVAGNGTYGYSGDGGPATSAELDSPFGVAVDSAGNLYFADRNNQCIRKVDAGGTITTVAGNGILGYSGDGGPATNAELAYPFAVAVDNAGNLYIADQFNARIRKVDASGTISTVAGTGTGGYNGDNIAATSAELYYPVGVAVDSAGNLYIADASNQRTRKVDASGTITTVAGTGTGSYNGDNIPAISAELRCPYGVGLDSAGNLYIADTCNERIREVGITSNQSPVARVGGDQTVECTAHNCATVTLNGSASSDPDGDALTYSWAGPGNTVVGTAATAIVTAPLGTTAYTLTVTDPAGLSSSATTHVTVQDTTPPVLSLSQTGITVSLPAASASGATVNLSGFASAMDTCDPSPTITNNAPSLFSPGITLIAFTATDHTGNQSQKNFNVQAVYNFNGYFMPILNSGASLFQSGRTIPVKFALTAADATIITNAVANLQVHLILTTPTGTVDETVNTLPSGSSNSGTLFRFDPTSGQYIYNLSTSGFVTGTYLLRTTINDGTTHDVTISIR